MKRHHRLGHSGWRWVQSRARRLVRNPARMQALLRRADLKPSQSLGTARRQLATLLRLLKAWLNGSYRDVSITTIVAATGAVLYFVLPLDLIPDFILSIGFLDDIAVILWVAQQINEELERFRQWEASQDH